MIWSRVFAHLTQTVTTPPPRIRDEPDVKFEYNSLHSPSSIRLLKVLPAREDNQFRLRLWEPKDTEPYRCLSYTWCNYTWNESKSDWEVSGLPDQSISPNGQVKSIGRSLYDFLETASWRFANPTLWIDALCINQEDDGEKSAQVQWMGTIYEGATEVLIWLGNDTGVVELFEWIRKEASFWASRLPCAASAG